MKKFFKRLMSFVCCAAVTAGAVYFGPPLCVRLFGEGNTYWISERFSETLLEKNELVVYEIETTGQETVTQDAWLLGTVQKVVMPYAFRMSFTVDLSRAKVTADADKIELRIPSPVPGYQKLTVDETQVRKSDWLYRLTPERYAEMLTEVEQKLFTDYSQNAAYQEAAWEVTVRNLEGLFQTVEDQSFLGRTCEIAIIRDDLLQ